MCIFKYITYFTIFILSITQCNCVGPISSVHVLSSAKSCTGFVVNDKFILTAASCIAKYTRVYVNHVEYKIGTIRRYPKLTKIDHKVCDDIALLELIRPLKSGNYRTIQYDNKDIYDIKHKCYGIYWVRTEGSKKYVRRIFRFKSLTFA